MAEPADMILPMLKEMLAEISDLRKNMNERFDKNDERFDQNDKAHKNFQNALSADTLMSRLLTGEFEERIEKLEKMDERIKRLETKVSAFEGRS